MSLLALPLIGAAFFLGGAWAASAVLYPVFRLLVARLPWLARATPLVAALPVLAGSALALAAFLPGDPHLDQLLGCHCATSMPGWLHLCPVHPTTAPSVLLPAAGVLVLLAPGRVRALRELLREPLGTGTGATPTLVDLPHPIAVLAGWLRPSLLVDRRLWAALEPEHRHALLAHERAHLARRDPLMLAVLRLVAVVAPPTSARCLLLQWLTHAERRADAAAASTRDPLVVAEALLRCARLAPPTGALQLGWTAGGLEGRVRSLVELRPGRPCEARPDVGLVDLGALALGGVCVVLSIPWVHHQVEHLLNLAL